MNPSALYTVMKVHPTLVLNISVSFYSIMLNAPEMDPTLKTQTLLKYVKKIGMTEQEDPALT